MSMIQTLALKVYRPLTPEQMQSLAPYFEEVTNHWTAGSWTWLSNHYHFNIPFDVLKERAYVVQTRSLRSVGSHVYKRNTGNIGTSMCGMGTNKAGRVYKIQPQQIEVNAKLNAELIYLFGPKNSTDLKRGMKLGLSNVHDHAYWATVDGYGPGSGHRETRIDIAGYAPIVEEKTAWYLGKLISGQHKVEHLIGVK